MELIITLRDFVFMLIGFALGYAIKCIQCKSKIENLEEIIIGSVVLFVWVYSKLVLQIDDWWLNIFVGIVLAHFFNMEVLKKKLGGLIK
jgi:hypothetical protein